MCFNVIRHCRKYLYLVTSFFPLIILYFGCRYLSLKWEIYTCHLVSYVAELTCTNNYRCQIMWLVWWKLDIPPWEFWMSKSLLSTYNIRDITSNEAPWLFPALWPTIWLKGMMHKYVYRCTIIMIYFDLCQLCHALQLNVISKRLWTSWSLVPILYLNIVTLNLRKWGSERQTLSVGSITWYFPK